MPTIDFPSSPVNGQQYTYAGVPYVFSAQGVWLAGLSGFNQAAADPLYVNVAGDTMSGALAIANATASTSPTTGALTVGGGVGIGGALQVGSTAQTALGVAGGATIGPTAHPNGFRTLSLGDVGGNTMLAFCLGGAERWSIGDDGSSRFVIYAPTVGNALQIARATGNVTLTSATASTSPTTGALTVTGGVGVGEKANIKGPVSINGATITDLATSTLVIATPNEASYGFMVNNLTYGNGPDKGVWFLQNNDGSGNFGAVNGTKRVSCAGDFYVASSTASTSPTTGALTVAGGVGVGGMVNVGGAVVAGGNVNCVDVNASDIYTRRAGLPTQGFIGFGNSGTKYLLFDSTAFSFVGARLSIADATASTSPTTGALTVAGGVGINGDLFVNAGTVHGSPTGGNKGAGTINATAVYDDNVLLTCFGTQYAARGTVDLAQWDKASPTGKHKLAHKFVDMLKDGFDPRDPVQYVQRMLRDEALPGMPTPVEWQHGELSAGEMINRLWLAVELLASAFAGAQTKGRT